jgi:hypothetical protein
MADLDKYFSMLKVRVQGMGVNPQSLIIIGRHAMEISEKSKLNGAEKKKLVLSMLTKIVDETELTEENKAACMALVDGGVVESTIDLVIEASKGHLKFNKKSLKRILKTCGPIFSCLRSVLAAPRRHPPSIPVVEVEAVEVEVVEVPAAEEEAGSDAPLSADAAASVSEEASVEEEVVAET